MRGASIARHPDVDYIISLVRKGHGCRSIADIINKKYEGRPRYRVTWLTVNDFIRNFMDLTKEDRRELRALAKEKRKGALSEKQLALKSKIQRKNSILDMKEGLAERRVDIQEELESLMSRAVAEIDQIDERVKGMRSDRDFVLGKSALISAIEQVRKIIMDIKTEQDDSIRRETNANERSGGDVVIQFGHVDAYVKAMKQSIVDTFRELGFLQELPVFLEHLSKRLNKINSLEISDATGVSVNLVRDENGLKAIAGSDHNG